MTLSYKVYQQIREGVESPRLSSSPNGSCSPRDSPVSLNQQTLKQRVSYHHHLLDHDSDIIMVIVMIFEKVPKSTQKLECLQVNMVVMRMIAQNSDHDQRVSPRYG